MKLLVALSLYKCRYFKIIIFLAISSAISNGGVPLNSLRSLLYLYVISTNGRNLLSLSPETTTMKIPLGKKIYFSSDNHLGAPTMEESRKRETIFVKWLDEVKKDAAAIFLLGDLFDFWFEYKHVVPKGFVRSLGKLAEIKDSGIPVYFFVGNHDLWMDDYFEEELNIPVFHKPEEFEFNDKKFLIGHGDGLGPGDKGYKRMKKVFTNPLAKWFYRWLHPDLGVPLAQYFSIKNKMISGEEDMKFLGEDKEWLIQYCRRKLESQHYDYFLFGHRHLPLEIQLTPDARYINTGDWINHYTYAEFDGQEVILKKLNLSS